MSSIKMGRDRVNADTATRTWRLLHDLPMTGARNMAVDEALLRSVGAGEAPPTLRLYGWQPACLSLGYGQRAREADTERMAERGWGIVRRLTGGRAILHNNELTYSLTLPETHPLAAGGVVESYHQISRGLLLALQRLGAQPSAAPLTERAPETTVCFETPSHYEITVSGKKLVGSAQARKHGGLLQHGTLPLTGDIARICDALVYADEAERATAKAQVHTKAFTLETALRRSVSWDEAADAVVEGFAEAFDIRFETGELNETERVMADTVERERYADAEWTHRR